MEELYKVMDDLLEVEFQMKAGMDILKELEEFYMLEKETEKAKKKYEKYLSFHESGEATTRQQTILFEAEERYRDLDCIVNKFKELRAFTATIKFR